MRSNFVVWGVFALIFAAAATLLTWLVVRVSPEEPQESSAQIIAPFMRLDDINRDAYKDDHMSQTPATSPPTADPLTANPLATTPFPAPTATPPLVDIDRLEVMGSPLYYYHERGRKAWITFSFVPGVHTIILMNHLTGVNACRVADDVPPGDPDQIAPDIIVQPLPGDTSTSDDDLWLVTLNPKTTVDPLVRSNSSYGLPWQLETKGHANVLCDIQPQIQSPNFTTQELSFEFLSEAPTDEARRLMADFRPAYYLNIDVSDINGANNVTYIGGLSSDKTYTMIDAPEFVRTIQPNDHFTARWELLTRSGARDAILVIVGSFIALAAAMAVEALRPALDHLIKDAQSEPLGDSTPQLPLEK